MKKMDKIKIQIEKNNIVRLICLVMERLACGAALSHDSKVCNSELNSAERPKNDPNLVACESISCSVNEYFLRLNCRTLLRQI